MKWLLLGGVVLGGLYLSRRWWLPQETRVSDAWIAEQLRRSSRVEHVGPSWTWPVNKIVNESPLRAARKRTA